LVCHLMRQRPSPPASWPRASAALAIVECMGQRTETRERILRAALRTLATEGFAATSARAIARTGGFAPGVIYYHFDDLQDLLLAALEYTSTNRLVRYRTEVDAATSTTDLLQRLRALYAEDVAEGHTSAVQELFAGASSSPRLARGILEQVQPWIDFTEAATRRLLAGTPLEQVLPAPELARAIVALYLGLETLTHLDRDHAQIQALFSAVEPAAALLDVMRPAPGRSTGGDLPTP
jgi:AcrR family transcriptional regulator